MNKRSHSSREVSTGVFAAHGFMEVSVSDTLNVMEAHGPFNKELVLAADRAQEKVDVHLPTAARWGTVLVFKGSALASPEAMDEIAKIVARRAEQGIRPVAIGLVAGADVEGGALMGPLDLRAYAASGIPGAIFSSLDAARDWVLAQL